MSTTTKETSILDSLKAQAVAIATKIKEETDKHLESLHLKLKDAHESVEKLTAEIRSHSGEPVRAKRGRKAGSKNLKSKATKPSKRKGKREPVGANITKFLQSKGKAGASIKEIAAHTGYKPTNVTAYFYAGVGKKTSKKVGKATFALK